VNHKGVFDGKELDKFRSVLNTVDTNKDGKISQSEFMTACQKGELKNIQL
jgi:Ca2+-binding EF-hand superfamily protein